MTLRRASIRFLLVGLLLTALTACGSGDDEAGPSAAPLADTTEPAPAEEPPSTTDAAAPTGECQPLPGVAVLCVDAVVSGGTSFDGVFTTPAATATCADFSAGDEFAPGTLTVLLVPPDDTPVSFDLLIGTYDGPGTYSGDQIERAQASAPPLEGAEFDVVLYNASPDASVTATVNPDGSGSFEISELVDSLTGVAPASASATWTCLEPA
jgi:hypothetical protein